MSGKIPVLVLAFNRADHVAEAMKAIRKYQPERLYLECDGPRAYKSGEKQAVEATRKAMLDVVDWSCEIKTLFREENLGCAQAVYGAINWFFEQEKYGIICEDDIVLGNDFFRLCEELLPRYANEDRIMSISAQNKSHRNDINDTYVYSYRYECWGWASWARAWEKMDMSMSAVPDFTIRKLSKRYGFFESLVRMYYWKTAYKNIENYTSWAARWNISIQANNGIIIVPGVNLAKNIGIDGGTHYQNGDVDPYSDLEIGEMTWPIRYNDIYEIDKKQYEYDSKDFWNVRMIGVGKKIRNLFKKLKIWEYIR
ncbi:MAG: hemolysin hemolytic protein [Salinivirgaceae bacterium]|nr:hemolysin hemolytic protein [Salinivirgaceae bacterium]